MFLYECIKFSYTITEKLFNFCLSKCNINNKIINVSCIISKNISKISCIINQSMCDCLINYINKQMSSINDTHFYYTYNSSNTTTNHFIFTNSTLIIYNFIFIMALLFFIYFGCLKKDNEINEINESIIRNRMIENNETDYLLHTTLSNSSYLPKYNEIDKNTNTIYKEKPPNYNEL
jgi:hypothetical protein